MALALSKNANITDTGAVHLAQAFRAGHLNNIKRIYLGGTVISPKGAQELAEAMSLYCPSIRFLQLPSHIDNPERVAIKDVLKEMKALRLSFTEGVVYHERSKR